MLLIQDPRRDIEEHMFRDMGKSTHEEHLSQLLQTNNKQFKIAVTFPTGYMGNFNVTESNNNFFLKSITDKDDWLYKNYLTTWCSRNRKFE